MAQPVRRSLLVYATMACVLIGSACVDAGADHQLLDRFFAASRLRDRTALARLATVVFEPHADGQVERFEIASATPLDEGTRELTVRAQIRRPDETRAERVLIVTITRAGDSGLATASSGWVVTGIR